MKRIIYLLLLILLVFSNCKKKSLTNNNDNENMNIEIPDTTEDGEINFDKMNNIIQKSDKLTVEVFFAISVLHKKFIMQFMSEVERLSEDDKKVFFLEKKKDFFKEIKYSEEEYYNFMEKNTNLMNEYIKDHKDIEKYLTSIN